MVVRQNVNSLFTSNTYVLSDAKNSGVWLVDIGDFESIKSTLSGEQVNGVFITHSHFDHIYGINDLVDAFPNCVVYISENDKDGLFSDKLNLSFYHETPMKFLGGKVQILNDGDKVPIFGGIDLIAIATPGHNPGCLTYKVADYLFTGDSFIPGVKVVTKLRGGNKSLAEESVQLIKSLFRDKMILCPGHGAMTSSLGI